MLAFTTCCNDGKVGLASTRRSSRTSLLFSAPKGPERFVCQCHVPGFSLWNRSKLLAVVVQVCLSTPPLARHPSRARDTYWVSIATQGLIRTSRAHALAAGACPTRRCIVLAWAGHAFGTSKFISIGANGAKFARRPARISDKLTHCASQASSLAGLIGEMSKIALVAATRSCTRHSPTQFTIHTCTTTNLSAKCPWQTIVTSGPCRSRLHGATSTLFALCHPRGWRGTAWSARQALSTDIARNV
mmetsp:Transcript_1337/g.3580  ORF Transcript_1337/g.3580 Transcript_1337/m.3580 type:complete len:245 (+) Transcript_1337:2771-3505(+)